MEYAAFLRAHITPVINLSDDELEMILPYFRPLKVARKELLIREGQIVNIEFLVMQGCLKTSAYDDDGKEHILQFALENWWVSDYPAYSNNGIAEMAVEALEPCVVLELSKENREAMCQAIPKMYIFHSRKCLSGFAASQKRILSLLRNSAKEKYELLLTLYPELFQRLPRKTIAHYLGVSRETLSRLEKKQ